jgi:hypothetical protein
MDLPLLPDRQYTSRDWPNAFDLTDVTDRITDAEAARRGAATPGPGASTAP